MLETREVLDDIKTRFFELDELTFGFTSEQKDRYLMFWVQIFKKITGQIRKPTAKDSLKQLQEEGLILTEEVAEEIQAWNWDGKGEKGERIYILLELYRYTSSRTEYITGTFASFNHLAISEQHGQRS